MKTSFSKKGASAIIAIGLSFLIIIVTLGVAESNIRTYKSVQASKDSFQAQMLAMSVQEELMLAAKNMEAGFSVSGTVIPGTEVASIITAEDAMQDMVNFIAESSGTNDVSIEYELQGMNSEAVESSTDGELWYTVPAANTGDAGYKCNDLRPVLTREHLAKYYPDTDITDGIVPIADLFNSNPLNHPCHWGKLGFGSNYSSKVNIPLYYQDGTGQIKNPADLENELNKIIVRLKTPCKPIEERTGCMKDDENGDRVIDKSKPNCQYKDICEDGNENFSDRWEFDVGEGGIDEDETIVLWSITGECTYELEDQTTRIETCTILPNDAMMGNGSDRNITESSEIYESLLNGTKEEIGGNNYYDSFKYSSLNIRKEVNSIENKKVKGKDPYSKMTRRTVQGKITLAGYIYNFITNNGNPTICPSSQFLRDPNCKEWNTRTINKPILQMSIIVPALKEKDDNKNIPYLEYQILTDNPIANNSQIYTAIVRYNDQVYKLEKEIDRKVNVIDFAVHN
jgi:hypothetical protein